VVSIQSGANECDCAGGERLRWAKAAYATPGAALAAETISLEISAVHEAGGRRKSKGIPIGVRSFLCMLS
jgi:hypothetical protein